MRPITITGSIILALVFLQIPYTGCVKPKLEIGQAEVIHTFADDPPLYASPEGIALDRSGNIFVSKRTFDGSSYLKNEIVKITPSGESSVLADLG
ncbi:MAG: hypothetical protein DRP71_11990, partial [Verrucomicrobia bacterium]